MRKIERAALAALVLGCFSTPCAYSNNYMGQTMSQSANSDFPQDMGNSASDMQLNTKIRNEVSRGILWDSYKKVTLNTNNGNVTLDGTVDSQSDKDKLINSVKKVDGVKSVQSNLTIDNGDQSNSSDMNANRNSNSNRNTFAGNWNQLKGKVKEKWGRLTNDDLAEINGRKDVLVGKLQARYGYSEEEARKAVQNFDMNNMNSMNMDNQ